MLGAKACGRHVPLVVGGAGVERVWVHTCTLDGPSALGFYIRSGFTPFARAVEIFPDPRVLGLLPRETAPQIPLLA